MISEKIARHREINHASPSVRSLKNVQYDPIWLTQNLYTIQASPQLARALSISLPRAHPTHSATGYSVVSIFSGYLTPPCLLTSSIVSMITILSSQPMISLSSFPYSKNGPTGQHISFMSKNEEEEIKTPLSIKKI